MYRAPSKRRQLLMRTGVYSVTTIAVLALVTFLVFIMLGYRFNRDTSSIQQGGLVQFASRPIDAKVTIGKAQLGDLTPSKITINPGNYDVSMARNGYKGWSKNVDVKAGEVLWLNYAQLVPNTVETEPLNRYDTLAGVKSSPNGDRFALLRDAAKPEITFLDVTGETPKETTLSLPADTIAADKPTTYELLDWANDSDRVLVKMTYESTIQYLVVDRRDAARTVNISKDYEADIAEPLFDPRSSERLIVRSSKGDVRLINASNDSLSSILAQSVTSMSLYGNDALLLVQNVAEGGQTVGYQSFGSGEIRELKRIASAERTLVSVAAYFSEPYIAISTGPQLDVFKVKSLPSSENDSAISMTNIHTTTLPTAVDYLSVRSGGRFVVAQYAGGVQTYDNELKKQTLTSLKTVSPAELRWLDGYHFYTTNGTELEVMEFDGANPHGIAPLATSFDVVQSDDGTFIYSINAVDGGFALQRSRMVLE